MCSTWFYERFCRNCTKRDGFQLFPWKFCIENWNDDLIVYEVALAKLIGNLTVHSRPSVFILHRLIVENQMVVLKVWMSTAWAQCKSMQIGNAQFLENKDRISIKFLKPSKKNLFSSMFVLFSCLSTARVSYCIYWILIIAALQLVACAGKGKLPSQFAYSLPKNEFCTVVN